MLSIPLNSSNQGYCLFSLQRLIRAVCFAQGEFLILFVEVPSLEVRRQIISALNLAIAPDHCAELSLHPSVTDLSKVIHQYVEHEEPKILSVEGLPNLENLDFALGKANFSRDQFQENFKFPMIWWVDSRVRSHLRRHAPDLSSCLTSSIQFL